MEKHQVTWFFFLIFLGHGNHQKKMKKKIHWGINFSFLSFLSDLWGVLVWETMNYSYMNAWVRYFINNGCEGEILVRITGNQNICLVTRLNLLNLIKCWSILKRAKGFEKILFFLKLLKTILPWKQGWKSKIVFFNCSNLLKKKIFLYSLNKKRT